MEPTGFLGMAECFIGSVETESFLSIIRKKRFENRQGGGFSPGRDEKRDDLLS